MSSTESISFADLMRQFVECGDRLPTSWRLSWETYMREKELKEAIARGNDATDLIITWLKILQEHKDLAVQYEPVHDLLEYEIGYMPNELSREVEYVFSQLFYSGVVSSNQVGEFLTVRGSIPKNTILRPKGIIQPRGRDVYSKWMILRFALQTIKEKSESPSSYNELFKNATRGQDLDMVFTFASGFSWKDFREVLGISGKDRKVENGILYEVTERTHMNGETAVTMMYIILTHQATGISITLDFAEENHDPHDMRRGDRSPNFDRRVVIHVVHHNNTICIKTNRKLLRWVLEDNSFKKRTKNLTDEVSRILRTLVDTSFYNPLAAIVGIPLESGETCKIAAGNIDYFVRRRGKLEGRRLEKEVIKDVLRLIMLQGKNAYYTFQDLHLLPLFPFGSRDAEEVMEIFELVQSFDRLAAEMILNPSLVVEILNMCDPRLTH